MFFWGSTGLLEGTASLQRYRELHMGRYSTLVGSTTVEFCGEPNGFECLFRNFTTERHCELHMGQCPA